MFTLDKPAIAKWIREDEEHVPDGGFYDENPAANVATLLDTALSAGHVQAPEGWSVQAIAIDEIEESGLVVCVHKPRPGEPYVGLTTGWTNLKHYIDRDEDGKPAITDPGERAADFLERIVVEANIAYNSPHRAFSLTGAEAQEMHEAIGAAIEGDASRLERARELAAVLVSDVS